MEISPTWVLRPIENAAAISRLQSGLNQLPEPLARSLVLRGVDTVERARDFFRSGIEQLHDPMLLADMPVASERLAQAIRSQERVVVYGDYDVDGTASTALLTDFLRARGVKVTPFVPHRFRHGYGLSVRGIDEAVRGGADLLVALDCGVTALEEAAYLRSLGIDLIVGDHHLPLATLPDAIAVVDPKRPDCNYPFDGLCACGVAFKLVSATLQVLGEDPALAMSYLDLVALATAADIVPLLGENRILLREGLIRIRTEPRHGIRSLARAARLDPSNCTARNIGFTLGPRINAAGRIADASLAVSLLLSTTAAEADPLANEIETLNASRRALDRQIADAAILQAETLLADDPHVLVLHGADWHLGVLGIVASRLVDRYARPAVVLTTVGDQVKGSARSVAGIPIYDALHECRDLLTAYGGHDFAAGMTLPIDTLSTFRERFDAAVRAGAPAQTDARVVAVDAELDLNELNPRFWAVLRQFAPHGCENNAPLFHARNLEVVGTPSVVGRDGEHLKFFVRPAGSTQPSVAVIAFRQGGQLAMVQDRSRSIELACNIDENVWNGTSSLQLQAEGIRHTPTGTR